MKNAYDPSYGGNTDVFLTKIAPAGNALVFSTFLGGSKYDSAYGIALESWPIVAANAVTLALAGVVLALKIRHR